MLTGRDGDLLGPQREWFFWEIITVVLCPLVVICVISWWWTGFSTLFRLVMFLGVSSLNHLLACPCLLCGWKMWWSSCKPYSPKSSVFPAGNHQITQARSIPHGQNYFLPCSCFIRQFSKNQLLTVAPAITDYGKCLGTCASAHDGKGNFAKISGERKNWASVVRKFLMG